MGNFNFEIIKKIAKNKLFVEKNKNNDFANFKFRTLDDILFKLKPQLEENNLYVFFSHVVYDDSRLNMIMNICDLVTNEVMEICGEIKIDWNKSKMDDSQRILSAKTFLKKSMFEDTFLLSSEDPDSLDNLDNIPQKRPYNKRLVEPEPQTQPQLKNLNDDKENVLKFPQKDIPAGDVKQLTDAEKRTFIVKALIELQGGKEEAKNKLIEYTTFKDKEKIVDGFSDSKKLKGKQLEFIYKKVVEEYNKFINTKENFQVWTID